MSINDDSKFKLLTGLLIGRIGIIALKLDDEFAEKSPIRNLLTCSVRL